MSVTNYLQNASWFIPIRFVLSIKYGFIVWLRNLFYDIGLFKTHSVKTPVISVGNISTGGSGKTILVQAIIEYFLSAGKRPSILSRGYGRSSKGLVVVADTDGQKASLNDSGDEPYLIASNYPGVPLVVSENRVLGANFLVENFSPDVIILDDGFQHRRLNRDLDILIVDYPASQKQHLLPRGNLREPEQNIARADVVLFSKNGLQDSFDNNLVFELKDHVLDHTGKHLKLAELEGQYGLFAGLGNPQYFFRQIEEIHRPAQVKISLPDHAEYSQSQLMEIKNNRCDYWITTQKDYIKLDPLFCEANNIYYISVSSAIPPALLGHLKRHFN